MRFTIQDSADKKWRWWLLSDSGREVGKCSQPYARKSGAIEAVRNICFWLGEMDTSITDLQGNEFNKNLTPDKDQP